MSADGLALSYDRANILERIRELARMLRQLHRSDLLSRSSYARKVYLRWYKDLILLRAKRDLLFPRNEPIREAPFSIL